MRCTVSNTLCIGNSCDIAASSSAAVRFTPTESAMRLSRLMSAMLVAMTIVTQMAAGQNAQPVQTPPPAAAPKITRLILLGTQGGPRVNADRAQSANVLIVNGTPYLIDAGNGVARQLSLAHVSLPAIHQIFITHNHDDHNADWGTLMGLAWTLGNTQPIT